MVPSSGRCRWRTRPERRRIPRRRPGRTSRRRSRPRRAPSRPCHRGDAEHHRRSGGQAAERAQDDGLRRYGRCWVHRLSSIGSRRAEPPGRRIGWPAATQVTVAGAGRAGSGRRG
jgi:hypothetical protein